MFFCLRRLKMDEGDEQAGGTVFVVLAEEVQLMCVRRCVNEGLRWQD